MHSMCQHLCNQSSCYTFSFVFRVYLLKMMLLWALLYIHFILLWLFLSGKFLEAKLHNKIMEILRACDTCGNFMTLSTQRFIRMNATNLCTIVIFIFFFKISLSYIYCYNTLRGRAEMWTQVGWFQMSVL